MRPRTRLALALAAGTVAAVVPAGGAEAANSYWLGFCQAAPNHSVEGFVAVQDRGLITRRDCAESGAVREGLIVRTARDTIRGRRRLEVPYRGVAGLSFQAPPGTVIKRVLWGGSAARRSCDWLAQLRIADETQPAAHNELLAGHQRDQRRCDDRRRRGPLRVARPKKIRGYTVLGNPKYDVPRPKTLYQRVLCVNRRGCPLGSDPQAYILTENLRLEIVDEQAPNQLAATGGDLFGAWINSDRTLGYTAADVGSGVKTVRAVNDVGAVARRRGRQREPGQRIGAGDAALRPRRAAGRL